MRYVKNTMGLAERQALEVAGMDIDRQAMEQEKQAAKLDYIAMMADVDMDALVADDPDGATDEDIVAGADGAGGVDGTTDIDASADGAGEGVADGKQEV